MIRTGQILRILTLALAFLLLLALVVIAEVGQSTQTRISQIILRSQERQVVRAELVRDLAAAETGQRSFLLTADNQQLALYRSARDRVAPALARLADLLREDGPLLMTSVQRNAMHQLQILTGTRLGEFAASLALYSSEGPQQAMELVRSDSNSPTMNEIRADAATLTEAEHVIVDTQLARAERLRLAARLLMGGVALLNVLLLIAAAALLARQARRRAALTDQLERDNERLEGRVRRRTAELSALSSHLQQLSETEKANLARELHDELGGLLIAVKMDASWLRKRWPDPAADIQARWARVMKVLDDGVDFKRRIVENLRPTLLDNMGLLPALRWVTQESCSRAGLQYTEIYPEQEPQLNDDAAIMLFRLVQESLTNVVKHAQATHVRVQIAMQHQEMTVLIEDNGVGIDTDRLNAVGSHGLAIMRHRVRGVGGHLDFEQPSHGGTRVVVRLPLAGILKGPQIAETGAPAPPPVPAATAGAAGRTVNSQR